MPAFVIQRLLLWLSPWRSDPRPESRFRPDIEGLRAIAILLVVAFHVGIPALQGGFIGVDVFFVISGYLITGLLVREVENTGRLNFLGFYARRARRLLPASALTLIVTVFVASLLFTPLERLTFARTASAAALYVSNIRFQQQALNYFGPDSNADPLLHTWTLAVEEQFYLVWPVLIFLVFWTFRSKRALTAAMLAISAASYAGCLWLSAVDPPAAFFALPARAWEFAIGGLASLLPAKYVSQRIASNGTLGMLGLAAIVAGAVLFNSETPFPSAALLPVLGTAAVLLSGVSAPWLLSASPLQLIGRLSYSWYLWHWPVLVFGLVVIPYLELPGRLIFAGLSLGLAAVSYALIENPIRFSRYLKVRTIATLCLAAVVTVIAVGISGIAMMFAVQEANTPQQQAITAAANDGPRIDSHCFLNIAEQRLHDCAFGNTVSPTTIVLFGDSKAAQWFSAFEIIANQQGWRLIAYTKQGCPTARVTINLWTMKRGYPECSIWRDSVLERITELKPALVVLGNTDGQVGPTRLSLQQWKEGTRATVKLLDEAGIPTLSLHDTPGMPMDIMKCLSQAASGKRAVESCAVARTKAVHNEVFQATKDATEDLPLASTLDLSDYICDADTCPPVRNGIIAYHDAAHLSDGYARTLAPIIERRIVPIVTRKGQKIEELRGK